MGEKSVILFHSLAQYSDMFTSYHCTIKQCNISTAVHKFIATTYKHNSCHILMNFYLLEDDDKSIELHVVHAVYFVFPIDAHYIFYIILLSIYSMPIKLLIASDTVCINSKNNSDVSYIYNSNYEILN